MVNGLKKYQLNSEKRNVWLNALVLALVPVLCVVLRCAIDGKTLFDVYLPVSPWNDELFYYKLTEGVLDYGVPQGYFGFNESHGRYLSFAAWSPVLLFFWVIYGLLFGWNLLSPILANLWMIVLALFGFGLLVKPSRKQIGMIALLYICFPPVTRFVLSCIPEVELFALFILFWGIVLHSMKNYKGYKVGIIFFLVMLMTWMRPYLILLLMTPVWIWVENSKKDKKTYFKIGGISFGIFAVTIAVYGLISYLFSAPYLTDLFYTEWIGKYFDEGLVAGIKYTVWKLITSMKSIIDIIGQNLLPTGEVVSAAGLYYFVFLLLVILLLWKLIKKIWIKKERVYHVLPELQMFLCMVGFFVADLLMYRLHEGGRHTLVYIVGMIVLLPFMGKENEIEKSGVCRYGGMIETCLVSICCLLVLVGRGNVPYEFSIPYVTEEYATDLSKLSEQLSENMILSEDGISYNNTVIWTLWDEIEKEDGQTETKAVDFGAYYALPSGFGVNLCDGGYVYVNLENLQSRYIGTIPGGNYEKRCIASGGKLIGECDTLVVYDMKP